MTELGGIAIAAAVLLVTAAAGRVIIIHLSNAVAAEIEALFGVRGDGQRAPMREHQPADDPAPFHSVGDAR